LGLPSYAYLSHGGFREFSGAFEGGVEDVDAEGVASGFVNHLEVEDMLADFEDFTAVGSVHVGSVVVAAVGGCCGYFGSYLGGWGGGFRFAATAENEGSRNSRQRQNEG